MFQSTPANFTAGDDLAGACNQLLRWFQSTPANFTAGDHGRAVQWVAGAIVSIHARQFHSGRPGNDGFRDLRHDVSIHARQFHSGRPVHFNLFGSAMLFQSTPANFTAGDLEGWRDTTRLMRVSIHARQFHSGRRWLQPGSACRWPSFNPRPPISQRATAEQHHVDLGDAGGFNPRPPISQRATVAGYSPQRPEPCFNPRPPISQRATSSASCARRCRRRRFNPRPPISQRATRRPDVGLDQRKVSIHARQFHSGRQIKIAQMDGVGVVSIHARQFHSGRRFSDDFFGYSLWFQSTPANFTAGDDRRLPARFSSPGFNPRPPISQRATGSKQAVDAVVNVSIHARQFHSGRRLQGAGDRVHRPVSIHARQFHSGRP